MVPKFRGDEDDFLDNEDGGSSRRVSKKKSPPPARSQALPADQANALVTEVFPKQCRVRADEDGLEFLCSYRRAELFGGAGSVPKSDSRGRTPVAVGDRVLIQRTGTQSGVVEGLTERRSFLCRPAPGRTGRDSEAARKLLHVIAANIDKLVIVASVSEPDFSPGLVDRYLIAASAAGIQAEIALTKIDLGFSSKPPGHDSPPLWDTYAQLGIPIFPVCSKTGEGVDRLLESVVSQTVVFSGLSGVGKTSLLRKLLKDETLGRVGAISASTQRGQHTTTSAILLQGPEGSAWIDTPGVREFGLVHVDPGNLKDFFPEFALLPCSSSGCTHEACEATRLPRYESYIRILESLRSGEN